MPFLDTWHFCQDGLVTLWLTKNSDTSVLKTTTVYFLFVGALLILVIQGPRPTVAAISSITDLP